MDQRHTAVFYRAVYSSGRVVTRDEYYFGVSVRIKIKFLRDLGKIDVGLFGPP